MGDGLMGTNGRSMELKMPNNSVDHKLNKVIRGILLPDEASAEWAAFFGGNYLRPKDPDDEKWQEGEAKCPNCEGITEELISVDDRYHTGTESPHRDAVRCPRCCWEYWPSGLERRKYGNM